jgi:hypothetical protein
VRISSSLEHRQAVRFGNDISPQAFLLANKKSEHIIAQNQEMISRMNLGCFRFNALQCRTKLKRHSSLRHPTTAPPTEPGSSKEATPIGPTSQRHAPPKVVSRLSGAMLMLALLPGLAAGHPHVCRRMK